MCCGFYPDPLGQLISTLTPGTEVVLVDLEGKETLDIIWIVDGYSALTADAKILSCGCPFSDVIDTGRHFDRYPVSEEAKQIAKEAEEAAREYEDLLDEDHEWEDEQDSEVPDLRGPKRAEWENFDSEPE